MTVKTETMATPMAGAKVLRRLDRLAEEVAALREEVARLRVAPTPSARVVEWAEKVNGAIDDLALSAEERQALIDDVPAPLRHAVAAECYRTNENITFGWAATIAGVFTWEVPELLRAYGVEVDEISLSPEEMTEQVSLILQHAHGTPGH
jgi:hypothetical protein